MSIRTRPIETLRATYFRLLGNLESLDQEADEDERVNPEDVQENLALHAEDYLHWARHATVAELDYLDAKDSLDSVKAEAKRNARTALASAGTKVTEGTVEELAAIDPAVLAAQQKANLTYGNWQRFRNVERAMAARKDMIQSLNSRQVKEMTFYPDDTLEEVRERFRQSQK